MTIRERAMCGALAFALLAPAVAGAQTPPTPRTPFAELFGRDPERGGGEYTAVQFRSIARAQIGQSFESDIQASETMIPDGLSGTADGEMIAEYMRERVQIAGQARYSYQEFRGTPAFGAPAFHAGVRADFKPTTRLSLHGGGQVVRSPFFQLMFLTPDQAGTLAPIDRSAILQMNNESVEGTAGITSQYTKRSSIELTAIRRETNFELQPQHSFATVGGRAQWRRQMTRDLAVRARVGREQLRQQTPEGELFFKNELLDLGVDYAKSLSLSRRTSLSFGTETSIVRENEGARHYRLNGNVMLDKRFQRTWKALLSVRRGTDFLPGFRAPMLTEQARVGLAGYLAKRLVLNVNGNATQGEVGFNDSRKFISYTGDAKLTFAMTRQFGVFTQYLYYHFQNPPDPQTLFLLPQGSRQSVSFGVQTWISILDKDKVPRDPR